MPWGHPFPWGGSHPSRPSPPELRSRSWLGPRSTQGGRIGGDRTLTLSPALSAASRAPAALQAGGRKAPEHVPPGHDRGRHRPTPLLPLRGVPLPGGAVPLLGPGEPGQVRGHAQRHAVMATRMARGTPHGHAGEKNCHPYMCHQRMRVRGLQALHLAQARASSRRCRRAAAVQRGAVGCSGVQQGAWLAALTTGVGRCCRSPGASPPARHRSSS